LSKKGKALLGQAEAAAIASPGKTPVRRGGTFVHYADSLLGEIAVQWMGKETVEKLGNLPPSERKIVTKETHQGCLSFAITGFSELFKF
jgi:hypothetical protein